MGESLGLSGSRITEVRSRRPAATPDLEALEAVQRRVLWLATAIVHHANRVRENSSGVKVGGHQASSASMVSLMTALWFSELRAEDRVSVKPHASPVLHAINYLLGRLERPYLESLRAFGGLQSYPSRTKDPDPVDYSTGSVGIGALVQGYTEASNVDAVAEITALIVAQRAYEMNSKVISTADTMLATANQVKA